MYQDNKSASNISILTYIVDTIKTLKWIRVYQIDKRDRERGIFFFLRGGGVLLIGLWEIKELF